MQNCFIFSFFYAFLSLDPELNNKFENSISFFVSLTWKAGESYKLSQTSKSWKNEEGKKKPNVFLKKSSGSTMKYTNLLENRVINACHFLICPTRQRGFVMRMIMMVVLVEVLTINDFCFCTFRKLYFHGKEESRQTYFKLGFYQKATREEDKHSPQGAFPFSLFSQPTQYRGKRIFNSYSMFLTQNSKCCQLILSKLQIAF